MMRNGENVHIARDNLVEDAKRESSHRESSEISRHGGTDQRATLDHTKRALRLGKEGGSHP
jgi:hypothetical protein